MIQTPGQYAQATVYLGIYVKNEEIKKDRNAQVRCLFPEGMIRVPHVVQPPPTETPAAYHSAPPNG